MIGSTCEVNETHDPALRSWVASANVAGCDFPIQNLPFAVYRPTGSGAGFRCGVAIGDQVLDLPSALACGVFSGAAHAPALAATGASLNPLMALSRDAWSALRRALSFALRAGAPAQTALQACLLPQSAVEYALPAQIGDYTDFYTSLHHATNVGRLFRPDHPLLPNYKWIPIGYHGRASTISVSGTAFPRPLGQIMEAGHDAPTLAPSRRLDFELEVGIFIGSGNAPGQAIAIGEAEQHVFGLCLLNDWSARDIQAWEYQPLGPFLAKNFATTISPWVVTLEALAPYRLPFTRSGDDPAPLPYLDSLAHRACGALDLQLQVLLQTADMSTQHQAPVVLAQTSYRHAYWTMAQMVTHHTVNGCRLQPGDLLGSGTLSGPAPTQAGALIELTQGGRSPLTLPNGETRTYLEDGDRVTLRGWCEKPGAARIGFGDCVGTVLPARC